MGNHFSQNLVGSFLLWLDHEILDKSSYFTNVSGVSLYSTPTVISSKYSYSAPYQQWVGDNSISGALIPSGITSSGNFMARGESGLSIDYNMGRILLSSNVSLVTPKINIAIKDFNIYFNQLSTEALLYDTKWFLKPPYANPKGDGGLPENKKTFPAIYVSYKPQKNEPFAMGGMDISNVEFRAVVLADSLYKSVEVCDILMDSARKNFVLFNSSELPYNVYGDYKSGEYNYLTSISTKGADSLVQIDQVLISNLSSRENQTVAMPAIVSIVDFKLRIPRYTRQ